MRRPNPQASAAVHRALAAAREPLGTEKPPPPVAVEAAFEAWLTSSRNDSDS